LIAIVHLCFRDIVKNMIRDVHWDLCIVDEAHKMAAYRYGQRLP
jgi:hypothetical protein